MKTDELLKLDGCPVKVIQHWGDNSFEDYGFLKKEPKNDGVTIYNEVSSAGVHSLCNLYFDREHFEPTEDSCWFEIELDDTGKSRSYSYGMGDRA